MTPPSLSITFFGRKTFVTHLTLESRKMMSSISWPSPDAEDEGPIDFSKKPSVSDSPTDLSNNTSSSNNNSHRQSPVTESDGSTDETKTSLPDLSSKSGTNGYKWKKAKTTCSSSSSAQSSSPASTAAAAALAAYNLTTPSPSPPEANNSMSLLSTTLQHNSTTSEVLCRLLQGAVYGASVGNGSNGAKLTSLPGLRDGMHHQPMDTSSTSENDDTLSPHRLDMNGSKASGSSSSSRKKGRPLPEELKDEAYWERRRKNNEAAKRSRDARRAKEYEVAIRATILEQENLKLRVEIASLKTELAKLRCLMYPAMQQQQQNQQSNQSNGNRKNRDSCCRHDHD